MSRSLSATLQGLVNTGDGTGSERNLSFQCESKNVEGIESVSSTESQESERSLFLPMPLFAIKCELVDRNRKR